VEHALGDSARKNTNHRNSTGCCDVASCRVIAHIQAAALNMRHESSERSFPHYNSGATGFRHCLLHAFRLFAASAFVDQDRPRQSCEQFFLERIRNAFGWVFANAKTDRGRNSVASSPVATNGRA
jgi:hypothetical protein